MVSTVAMESVSLTIYSMFSPSIQKTVIKIFSVMLVTHSPADSLSFSKPHVFHLLMTCSQQMKFFRLYTIFPLACPFIIYAFWFHLFLPWQYWHFQFPYCESSFSPILQKQSQTKISTIFQGSLHSGKSCFVEEIFMLKNAPWSLCSRSHQHLLQKPSILTKRWEGQALRLRAGLHWGCSLSDTCSSIKYYALPCSLLPFLAYPSFLFGLCCDLTLIIGLMIRRGDGSIV